MVAASNQTVKPLAVHLDGTNTNVNQISRQLSDWLRCGNASIARRADAFDTHRRSPETGIDSAQPSEAALFR